MKLNKPIIITEQKWPEGTIPVISIFNWVYNHKDFIRASIESILIQKTNFPIEIIIHDDASNDGTKEIILEYQTKYPQLFNNILQEENQWSQGKSVMTPLFEKPKGKYLALSHGDDYWTDPLKLQKQVDFLEANNEYVMSFHDAIQVDETNFIINDKASPYVYNKDLNSLELKKVAAEIPTMTRVFRNVLHSIPIELENLVNGDVVLASLCGQFGKCKYMQDIEPSAYRIHSGGTWSGTGQLKRIKSSLDTCHGLYKYYDAKNDFEVADSFFKQYLSLMEQLYWYSFQYRNWFYFKTSIFKRFQYRNNIQNYNWKIEMKNIVKFKLQKNKLSND
jgi:glycosyltransferase involved in cell wall biosynthesis